MSSRETVGAPLQHEHDINSAAFSGDGAKLATGTTRGSVRLWDARSGAALTPPPLHRLEHL